VQKIKDSEKQSPEPQSPELREKNRGQHHPKTEVVVPAVRAVPETVRTTRAAPFSAPTRLTDTPTLQADAGILLNPLDGAQLVTVPAGKFRMGSEPGQDPYFWGAEGPAHNVTLKTFALYKTEVTNAMYQKCAADKACPRPANYTSETRKDYYTNPEYANYPVVNVSWVGAVSYCKWAGARLPTEAEWEKAARGTDGRLFPWGSALPSASLLNYCDTNCPLGGGDKSQDDGYRDTAPVGNYPEGASPYGALDMAGNVWEWVRDFFSAGYYQVSPLENPTGPASGKGHVIRGGSFANPAEALRDVARVGRVADDTEAGLGFRCAADAGVFK